jgi:predicted HTH transcriptional regulator
MQRFYSKFAHIFAEGWEVNLFELMDCMELNPNDSLANLLIISRVLDENNLDISPTLHEAAFETMRVVRPKVLVLDISAAITAGETQNREFKSSAFTDLRKFTTTPGLSSDKYFSEEVFNSSIKTIAGFLNSDGGDLLLGITDQGEICGVEVDFMHDQTSGIDKWELALREGIKRQFIEGKIVLQYIKTAVHESNGHVVVHVSVAPRARISFVRFKDQSRLYLRQGNQTNQVEFHEIESFFQVSRRS